MDLLHAWLSELDPSQKLLDLGCGAGSFDYASCSSAIAIGVDTDLRQLAAASRLLSACADSTRLPFPQHTFDLAICHHSLEHFRDVTATIREIRRVLKPSGRIFVCIPDGMSFSDRLYRLLLAGGGHFQRFSLRAIVGLIESETALHLVSRTELFTSFIYVDKRNFVPAPLGRLPGPLPRRMRWLGRLPAWSFDGARLLLNIGSRLIDRCFRSRVSSYGWALAFDCVAREPALEPGSPNVCMSCGAAFESRELALVARFFYRCPGCSALNPLFRR